MTIRPVSYLIVGVDGSRWRNVGARDCTLAEPMRFGKTPAGLAGAGFRHQDGKNVDQAGVTWNGLDVDPNIITLRKVRFGPVPPGEDALDRWLDFLDAFGDGSRLGEFHALSRRRATQRDRFQFWRLASELPDPDHDTVIDSGYVDCGDIKLRSDESWWRTVPLVKTFTAAQFAGASVPNISDGRVWGHWEVRGPIANPVIGLAGEAVPLGVTIPAGQTWRINTDPDDFYVRDGAGLDRTFLKKYWRLRAPALTAASLNNGTSDVPVTLSGTGTSSATLVTLTLPQVYRRAL